MDTNDSKLARVNEMATNDQTTKLTPVVTCLFLLTFFYSLKFITDPDSPEPPPTEPPPPEYPNANAFDQAYDLTTTNHIPSLEEFMTNADPTAPEFMLTDGPFGFGYAVAIDAEKGQCLKRSPYATADDCSQNPSTCKAGFSLSIWERVNISFDVFYTVHKLHQDKKRYILSTGGDEFGHPGVAIYHQGLALVALVSTGDKYWKLEVLGPFENSVWNNIGIRWMNSENNIGGLELYINAIKVGHEHHSKDSSPAKEFLDPSEMLIGCHKDADDTSYRGFNNADFDEFAYWDRRLPDDQTIFFMGGYEGSPSNLAPEEFAHMLAKTNMKDPVQTQIAMAMFNAMIDSLAPEEGQANENNTAPQDFNGTKPLDPYALKLKGMADVVHDLTNIDNLKSEIDMKELNIYMDIIKAASKILDESNAEKWHEIEDSGHRGAPGVKEDIETYIRAIGKRITMEKKSPEPKSFTKFTDNIFVSIEKMALKDYHLKGNTYTSPQYSKNTEMRDFWLDWDTPVEKVFVPTTLVGGFPECDDYHVSVSTVLYDSMDEVGPSRVNPSSLNDKAEHTLDSRVIKTSLNVYPPASLPPDSTVVDCSPSGAGLHAHPVEFIGGHKYPSLTIRHPTFHHDELNTMIYERHCVWWNSEIGEKGAWDSDGCLLLKTTEYVTKCSCKLFGSYAIISEHREERIPPYEPGWLKGIKIFLYIFSDICLLFYILVVALSGDLKDQFHLSGLVLSACLFGGSIGMMLSDLESIQHGRHECAAIGVLIQGFYLLSALWVTMLGHAGFKATTRGIIAGQLQSYGLVSFGVTLIVIGISLCFFIHDLGTDPRCFVAWFNSTKLLLFFFPVIVCLGVSLFFACVILFNVNHSKKLNMVIQTAFSSFISGSTIVMIYFVCTWIIGVFSYIRINDGYSGLYPIFQIMNSLMGVVVLISIGFLSSKFRGVLTNASKRRGEILQKMKDTAKNAKDGKLSKGAKSKKPPPTSKQPPKPPKNQPPPPPSP
ncbi:adhesion G-protein coupled receptor D1-like [Palaemon carinicauda]|uniref:adhesion G-protein coupled receptor D1-like n=1 Tax=Palaemon carinicauda TaxID=392227 RepID=UPI0035B63C74